MGSLFLDSPAGRFIASFPALSAAAGLLLAIFLGYIRFIRTPKLDLPVVGNTGDKWDAEAHIVAGARKYPDTPYILPMDPPIVVLPIKIQDEVRNLPENVVSFTKEHRRNFFAHYTGIGDQRDEMINAIRQDLTRHIQSTIPGLQEEVRFGFDKEFGDCKDWSPFPLYMKVLRIVALTSGKVFVGRPLSREEEWLQRTIAYTMDCVKARNAIREYPWWQRPFVTKNLPEIAKLTEHRKRGGALLKPIMDAQLAKESKKEKIINEESGDEEGSFISWLLKHTPGDLKMEEEHLALNQMVLAFASVHTSSMSVTHAILELVTRPEYFKILRDEIEQVRKADGNDVDDDGYIRLKKESIQKLRKLDSFMKESQRFNPPISTSGTRICTSNLKLSTGHTLPKGTRICFPSYDVHHNPATTTYSPEYNPPGYTPPDKFDGLRFFKLREMPGKESRHQFATANHESLVFGFGNHTCPGRFFAANQIKIILAELLMNWEVRLKGDVEQKGGVDKRPQNMVIDLVITPNPMSMIEMKRRTRAV